MNNDKQSPPIPKSELDRIEKDADSYNINTFACSRADYKNILISEATYWLPKIAELEQQIAAMKRDAKKDFDRINELEDILVENGLAG